VLTELHREVLSMPTARVGPENPLPPLFATRGMHEVRDYGDADAQMRRNIEYGRVPSVLPYLIQDGYGRETVDAQHEVAILENDRLRATFLLETGGRLWSLVHKPTDRELLHRNPIFQPANLALRNAWVAGGVEWNLGTIGHSPLTCEPLHAVVVRLPDGSPALRMYEFERMREVVFQIDAWLPEHSAVLLVRVRIVNPNDHEVPIYWWSNAAVPLTDDVRVLAPARTAWQFTYDGSVRRVDVPEHDGRDQTYPARASSASDCFFSVEGDERRWVAALDATGRGLVQTSTDLLRGRKLFQWGSAPGGRHWQEWLSGPGSVYLEIQAGLARTQLEHLPMAARQSWSWVEAYGLLEADPEAVHSSRWDRAVSAAADGLERLLPRRDLDRIHETSRAWQDSAPESVLLLGSGWGALERRLRQSAGDTSLLRPGTPFGDESLGEVQRPWLELLATGRMGDDGRAAAPRSYQIGHRWTALLQVAPGWLPLLHLGVAKAAQGDLSGAHDAWSRSLEARPTAWARRNLAVLSAHLGDANSALEHYRHAVALRPDVLALTLEYVELLLQERMGERTLEVIHALPRTVRGAGRIELAEARAYLLTGDFARCRTMLEHGIEIPDLREGEGHLHEVWIELHAALRAAELGRPVDETIQAEVAERVDVPWRLDFRMR
jgi:tetratricopeptide (TPR) repeat protein